MFALDRSICYDGDHEHLSNSFTIEVEFLNAARNSGLVREYAYSDTYDGHSAFSAQCSQVLLERCSMMAHPAFWGRESELSKTDQQKRN